jgi:hypothetical protein
MTDNIETEYNLEELPYPMFELSKGEINILSEVDMVGYNFLCISLHCFRDSEGIIFKIMLSLKGFGTLNDYMDKFYNTNYFDELYSHNQQESVRMRNIWIRKLIEFNEGK